MEVIEFQEKIKSYAEKYRNWKKPIDEFQKKFIKEHNIELFDSKGAKKLDLAVQEFTKKYQAQNADPTEMIFSFLDQEYEAYLTVEHKKVKKDLRSILKRVYRPRRK